MEDVSFNYDKLKRRIRDKCKTQQAFASAIGIGRVSLSARLNNKIDFTRNEIIRACAALDIDGPDIPSYFFEKEVQKSEQSNKPA